MSTLSSGFHRSRLRSTWRPSRPGIATSSVTRSGSSRRDPVERLQPGRRLADDPEPGMAVQHAHEGPPDEGRVVHHEDADHQAAAPFR